MATKPAGYPAEFIDYRAKRAKTLIRDDVSVELNTIIENLKTSAKSQNLESLATYAKPQAPESLSSLVPGNFLSEPVDPHDLPIDPDLDKRKKGELKTEPLEKPYKLCIIGAGITGLYIALILDSLKIKNVSYTILERGERVGGRVYTQKFSDKEHDYYDIGAMRFPNIPIMKRTFELFKKMKVPQREYFLQGKGCPQRFNDYTIIPDPNNPNKPTDPFRVSVTNKGNVPNDVVDRVDEILNGKKGGNEGVFEPYKKALKADWKEGLKLLQTVDEYSTREYLKQRGKSLKPPAGYDLASIQWMETMNTSSGLFDQGFSESVFDALDFDYGDEDGKNRGDNDIKYSWVCIEGGTSLLTDKMKKEIGEGKIQLNKRVDAISLDRHAEDKVNNVFVRCSDDPKKTTGYATVFNTTPLGCLQRMDLTGLELDHVQKDAIRCLHYDHSVKVAIKFKTPWWRTKCGITEGGIASTDLPLRTCVYPSYNIKDDPTSSAVLLVSYTWAQDASRIAALVRNEDGVQKKVDSELMQLILYNLLQLHRNDKITSIDDLRAEYDSHHAFSWADDPSATGAFALFGPGQFKQYYSHLTRPAADCKFHMAGEASSTHHAWIVGSLESAYRSVYYFLRKYKQWDAIEALKKKWDKIPELEMEEDGTAHLQMFLGSLKEEDQAV